MDASLIEFLLSDLEVPDAIVEELWVFRHWVVAKTVKWAMSSIPEASSKDLCEGDTDVSLWKGRPVSDVVREGMASCEPIHRASAAACLNSSVRTAPSLFEGNAMDPFYEMMKTEPTCFIGHFEEGAKLRDEGYPVTIVELVPRDKDVHWNEADEPLRKASLVFLTGLTLLNNTFDQVIARTPNARIRVLMGPTVPCSAQFLACGVHVVGGTSILNPESVLRYFQYGGTSIKRIPKDAISRFNIVSPKYIREGKAFFNL